ncbi:PspA/IM30 family protein [Aeromicrobium sp. A1-2]|uniref:PspA/IM30 family protein n=1 Tax=Aeromicrobium sp. A1-2 TaxID=2107713 RepID=UPI0013C30498|nr:PspA/IM30 family protein [Aeromicrobium sp. A1-2]
MSLGSRIATIFRSWRFRGDDVDGLKDRLDETYRTQTALLRQVRRGVADVATSRKRVELQLVALTQQSAQLDDEARQAVARGDDDGARSVLTRKVAIEKAAQDLTARHADLKSEENNLTATALKVERDVEAFRVRKDTLAARHTAAAARAEINSATSGINSSVSDVGQAMASAERRTRELEATADAVDELVADGIVGRPGESADAALGRQFDAALDDAEVDRQLEQISGHGKDDDGTDTLPK